MNIMLNKVCNLTCPYCFANEFVGRSEQSLKTDKSQISIDNFKTAMEFGERSKVTRVGLIGGEPLIHPKFGEIASMAIKSSIPKVHLFTNGVYLDRIYHLFGNDKFTAMVNINSPEDIGDKNYTRMLDNLEYIINDMHAQRKISVGVNIYKEDMDFGFITDVIKKYGFKKLRLSITVPNTNEKRGESSIEYFKRMKPTTFKLFKELQDLGCMPNYDCNGMPVCVTTDEEKEWLKEFWKFEKDSGHCNITECHKCTPIIDILPNLDAVRCFGLSESLKINIRNVNTIKQLQGYFQHEIDSLMNIIPSNDECVDCLYKNTNTCDGGCLAFKLDKFDELKNIVKKEFIEKRSE